MAKVKGLIKKEIREMAQDAIVMGLVFQYQSVTVEQIAANATVSLEDAKAIHAEMKAQGERIVKLFDIDPAAFAVMLETPQT